MSPAPSCHLCNNPAFGNIEGLGGTSLPICVEHYIQLQGVENERQRQSSDAVRQNMAMLNLAAAEMNAVTGLNISPSVVIPSPTPASNYSAVNVTGSAVGVINTGTVREIAAHVGAMSAAEPAKAAIEQFASVITCQKLLLKLTDNSFWNSWLSFQEKHRTDRMSGKSLSWLL